jgi:3-oxo-5-alpha-steroid 4-dehydrogenase 1
MNETAIFRYLLMTWFGIATAVFITLFFFTAPYGRHTTRKWGRTVTSRWGWISMEYASPLVFALCYVLGPHRDTIPEIIFLVLWEAHYIHRAFIYPLRLRGGDRPMPLAVIGPGLLFNAVNSYLNGRYVYNLSGGYTASWLSDPRFIAGVAVFAAGYIINRHSDQVLRSLRGPGESDYKIPCGGLHRWISCPNYLGEIMIWTGWAIATWSLAGLSFAIWTAANLVPRARSHHLWYRKTFSDYPPERKALIPGLW